MRLTIAALGWTLDWSLEPTTAEADDDPSAALNGGSLTSYPVGFVAAYDLPDEVPFPQRTPAWDDEE